MTTLNSSEIELDDGDFVHPGRRMTEDEFVAWYPEKSRAEWVDGEVLMMAPASDAHADLQGWLMSIIRVLAEEKNLGVVRGSESMVRLRQQRSRRVPDILFVARDRQQILRKNHIEGPPDLIIEIVSPDSVSRDWREKYLEYEAAGVREYWVIDPVAEQFEAYELGQDGRYRRLAEAEERVTSRVLTGFYLRPPWLWRRPLPKGMDVLRELGVLS